jgi:hypothetical protein
MRLPVVSGHRPILLHRNVRRHVEAIGLATVESLAIFVSNRDCVELPGPQTLDADKGIAVAEPAAIDRV